MANERDVLKRFQHRTPYLRPLVDEIEEESLPSTIALKYLEDDLLRANIKKKMNRKELKYVSKRILEALKVLHGDNYVHTGNFGTNYLKIDTDLNSKDVKLDNVFVNYREGDIRFSDVQLGDLGDTCPSDSYLAKEGILVGAPMWSSPEVIMETPWNTATDIWSFGAVVCLINNLRAEDMI